MKVKYAFQPEQGNCLNQHKHTGLKSHSSHSASFNIKVSPQQRYSLKWNHSVWSESKLNFPWCPAWQEALSGDWRSQVGKQFSGKCIKELSLCIYDTQRCFCLSVPPFTQKGAAASGMLRVVLGSRILKGVKERFVNSAFILTLATKATCDGSQRFERTLWNNVQV